MPRIGVFGGTFDPPHIAHLVAALDVRAALGLDRVLMVVAAEPWQKVDERQVSPAGPRLEMVQAAVADLEGLEASDIEMRRGGPTYTVDTLAELRRRDPTAELFLILGADAAAGLDTWHRPGDLAELCTIVVVPRPGVSAPVPPGFHVEWVRTPMLEISSTELRARAAAGSSLRFLVPDAVRTLIEDRGLYGWGIYGDAQRSGVGGHAGDAQHFATGEPAPEGEVVNQAEGTAP